MRRLWVSDVHANLPAFEAVLRDAGPVDEVVFLGDIVGCGPHPAACVDLLRGLGPRAILGNHDAAVLAVGDRPRERSAHVVWDEWTFDQLEGSQRSFLEGLPEQLTISFCGLEASTLHKHRSLGEWALWLAAAAAVAFFVIRYLKGSGG